MFNGERSTASTTGPIDTKVGKGPTCYKKLLSSYTFNIQNLDFKNQAPTSMVYYLNRGYNWDTHKCVFFTNVTYTWCSKLWQSWVFYSAKMQDQKAMVSKANNLLMAQFPKNS